jgi:hypothetical protein
MADVIETRAQDTTYNGWKNRSTWNAALWIGNDEGLYRSAVAFMETYKGRRPYAAFLEYAGLEGDKTPDGIKWDSRLMDYKALNGMMRELIDN